MNTNHIRWVHGIDFSGAKDAGRKIWVANGLIRDKELEITDCRPAKELPGSGRELFKCLPALINFISEKREAIFGIDFPFGLPASLVDRKNWKDFVISFRKRFSDPKRFKEECFAAAHYKELPRVTDMEQRTPFSPYNLWLYKQTYYGIQDLIEPLVRKNQARFLPMQEPVSGKPWVVEICPAVTLKREGLYSSYKGKTLECYNQRLMILAKLIEIGNLRMVPRLEEEILNNAGGDALDSVIAAFATFRNLPNLFSSSATGKPIYMLEGYVYA